MNVKLEKVLAERLNASVEKIVEFCQRWSLIELALFGSVLRDDFHGNSDVDVLVVYDPVSRLTWSDRLEMQGELVQQFGRKVDVVEKQALVNPFPLVGQRFCLFLLHN